MLRRSPRQPGRFDLPGAVTATGRLAALVYGLSSAATSPDGVSHSGDGKVVAALAASAVLLAAFAVIQARSGHALLPLRLLADRDRTGANLSCCAPAPPASACSSSSPCSCRPSGATALKTGLAYLPLTAGVMAASGTAAQLIPSVPAAAAGAPGCGWRPVLAVPARCAGSYAGAVLGPMLVIAAGLGFLFVPLTLVAMSKVADAESRVAAACATPASQVGGAIGSPCSARRLDRRRQQHPAQHPGRGHRRPAPRPARPSQAGLTANYPVP